MRIDNWYTHLNQSEEDLLRKNTWLHLPQLKFPISMHDWHPYGEAFANWSIQLGFELKPDRVEWMVEPRGDEQEFYVLNRDSRNKAGLFEEDFVSAENTAIQEAGIAEFTHIGLLRDAIHRGDIEQLDPNSNISTKTYLTYGKISIASLKRYVKKFKIKLHDDNSCADHDASKSTKARLADSPFIELPRIDIDSIPKHLLRARKFADISTANKPDPGESADILPTTEVAAVKLNHTQEALKSSPNSVTTPQSIVEASTTLCDHDWRVHARFIADECFDHDTNANPPVRDSLSSKNSRGEITGGYAFRAMVIMQERGIKGPRGIINNPATIMRDALQGKHWWANKKK